MYRNSTVLQNAILNLLRTNVLPIDMNGSTICRYETHTLCCFILKAKRRSGSISQMMSATVDPMHSSIYMAGRALVRQGPRV